MSIEKINPEIIVYIINFYAHITRREEINEFHDYGKRFLDLIINHYLITKDDTNSLILLRLTIFLNKYNSLNDRSKVFIHEILDRVLI